MKSIKYPGKDLIELLYKKKTLTMAQMINVMGCSKMTVVRILRSHQHGYLTSYNFNARYYTLVDIPEFDKYGLWTFADVLFSKYCSLTNTITQVVCHSPKGLEKKELEEILSVKIDLATILPKLLQQGCINKKRLRATDFYFNPNNEEMEKQIKKREKEAQEKIKLLLPEPERILAVLVDIIQHPRPPQHSKSQIFHIYLRLSEKGIRISMDEIDAIFFYYDLKKKKRLKY